MKTNHLESESQTLFTTPLVLANDDDEVIVDAEIIEDDDDSQNQTTGSEVVVTTGQGDAKTPEGKELTTPRHERTVEMYLAHPGGASTGAWKKGITQAGKSAQASVAAAADYWEHVFSGEPLPGWVAGRLGRTAQGLIKRDRRDPILVVRCAKGLPLLAKAYQDAWVARFNDTPPQSKITAAVFEAFALASEGKEWGVIQEALATCAMKGNGFVTNTYIDLMARRAGRDLDRATENPNSLFARARAVQELIDGEAQNAEPEAPSWT